MEDYKKAARRMRISLGKVVNPRDPRVAIFEDAELDKIHRDCFNIAMTTFAGESVRGVRADTLSHSRMAHTHTHTHTLYLSLTHTLFWHTHCLVLSQSHTLSHTRTHLLYFIACHSLPSSPCSTHIEFHVSPVLPRMIDHSCARRTNPFPSMRFDCAGFCTMSWMR